MFADGSYLFDAGWLFFALWSIALLAFFVIAFGEDLLAAPRRRPDSARKKTNTALSAANSRNR